MHIILLTHQRERVKKTNTGQLVVSQPGLKVTRIIWERTSPDPALLKWIEEGTLCLLYPEQVCSDSSNETLEKPVHTDPDCSEKTGFILIDSTWQEARKIFNRSPYLKHLPRLSLEPADCSLFRLRRNQIAGGLCTAESVIALLRMKHQNYLATKLESDFYTFIGHNPG